MNLRERVLYHQIHPLKLGTDISAAVVSTVLLWCRHPRLALLVNVAPPIVISSILLRWADLKRQRQSAFGQYIRHAMTWPMETVRFTGNVIILASAWQRRSGLLALGLMVVLAGWVCGSLWRPDHSFNADTLGDEQVAQLARSPCGD